MTQLEYGNAQAELNIGIEKFIKNKYIQSIIPDQVTLTLELLIEFISVAKDAIFRDGQILQLSVWNILRWWKFLKLAHEFVKSIINVWK